MSRQFPYFAAAIVTSTVGAIASVVWAAQVPVHPVSIGAHPGGPHPVAVAPVPVPDNTNVPTESPVHPGQTVVTPGFGVAQQVGTGGAPGVPSFTTGYGTTSPFGQTLMNQPGQPPFTEGFSGNQGAFGSQLDVPGQPDFYDGFGFNRGVVPPNQGASPMTPYPNQTVAPSSPPPSPNNGTGAVLTSPSVGFYNGFGGGQPDFGFYAGFTTPR